MRCSCPALGEAGAVSAVTRAHTQPSGAPSRSRPIAAQRVVVYEMMYLAVAAWPS